MKNTIRELLLDIQQVEVSRYQKNDIPLCLQFLKTGYIEQKYLKKMILYRYELSHMFVGLLEHIAKVVLESSLPKEEKQSLYKAVYANYLDETGEGYGGPHHEGRKMLIESLGENYENYVSVLGTYKKPGRVHGFTTELLDSIKQIVTQGPIQAITLLWYYENRISLENGLGDYFILLRAFERTFPQWKKASIAEYKEGDPLYHLASHADHDTHHAQLCFDGLASILFSEDELKNIEYTCIKMTVAFDRFWNQLWKEVVL